MVTVVAQRHFVSDSHSFFFRMFSDSESESCLSLRARVCLIENGPASNRRGSLETGERERRRIVEGSYEFWRVRSGPLGAMAEHWQKIGRNVIRLSCPFLFSCPQMWGPYSSRGLQSCSTSTRTYRRTEGRYVIPPPLPVLYSLSADALLFMSSDRILNYSSIFPVSWIARIAYFTGTDRTLVLPKKYSKFFFASVVWVMLIRHPHVCAFCMARSSLSNDHTVDRFRARGCRFLWRFSFL